MEMVIDRRDSVVVNALAIAAHEEERRTWMRLKARDQYRRWHLFAVAPQYESAVSGHLVALKIDGVYTPMMRVMVPVYSRQPLSGKRILTGRKHVHRPMFPGYMFVRFDYEAEWAKIRSRIPSDRARTIDHTDGRPYVIHNDFMKALHAKEQELLAVKADKPHTFKAGQQIRVLEGPFADLVGQIERLDSGDRIRALLELFGRPTPVSLAAHEIEAM